MNLDVLKRLSEGLDPNPANDLSRSMIFHDRSYRRY